MYLGRAVVLYGVSIVAQFLLTVYLTASEFGVFGLVQAAVNVLVYFSDIGLGAALIQKKSKLTSTDLSTTFFTQLALLSAVIGVAIIAAPWVQSHYLLSTEAMWLYVALLFSLATTAFRTIPSILLERQLKFTHLVIPQILETLVFYVVAVTLASRGMGVTSYTYAVFLRAIVGAGVLFALQPFVPRFEYSKKALKKLVRFGGLFQLNSLLALVKDDLLFLFVGSRISTAQIGYLRWGMQWARTPFQFFSESMLKVLFPAFSRLQTTPESLKKAVKKTSFFTALSVFPAMVGLFAIAPFLVAYIPRYDKWQPALIVLTLFSLNYLIASISTIFTVTLNSLGKVGVTLQFMLLWIGLSWAVTLVALPSMGYVAYPLAIAVTAASSLLTGVVAFRILRVNVIGDLIPGIFGTIVMYLFIQFVAGRFITSLSAAMMVIIASVVVYVAAVMLVFGRKVVSELQSVRNYAKT